MTRQSFEAPEDPDSLLRLETVERLVGLRTSAIYWRVKAGTFPSPVKLSPRCVRWRAGVVREWIAQQVARSEQEQRDKRPADRGAQPPRTVSPAARALLSEAA